MPTAKTAPTKQTSPKTAKKAVKKQTIPVQGATVLQSPVYGGVETVTSLKLKRRRVNDAYYASFFIPDSTYTWLNALGLQLGVTWDEALRGIIEQHQASGDQITGLLNFVPALQ
jgi:hypothetical protein